MLLVKFMSLMTFYAITALIIKLPKHNIFADLTLHNFQGLILLSKANESLPFFTMAFENSNLSSRTKLQVFLKSFIGYD